MMYQAYHSPVTQSVSEGGSPFFAPRQLPDLFQCQYTLCTGIHLHIFRCQHRTVRKCLQNHLQSSHPEPKYRSDSNRVPDFTQARKQTSIHGFLWPYTASGCFSSPACAFSHAASTSEHSHNSRYVEVLPLRILRPCALVRSGHIPVFSVKYSIDHLFLSPIFPLTTIPHSD